MVNLPLYSVNPLQNSLHLKSLVVDYLFQNNFDNSARSLLEEKVIGEDDEQDQVERDEEQDREWARLVKLRRGKFTV
jgi:hypothetical protein